MAAHIHSECALQEYILGLHMGLHSVSCDTRPRLLQAFKMTYAYTEVASLISNYSLNCIQVFNISQAALAQNSSSKVVIAIQLRCSFACAQDTSNWLNVHRSLLVIVADGATLLALLRGALAIATKAVLG